MKKCHKISTLVLMSAMVLTSCNPYNFYDSSIAEVNNPLAEIAVPDGFDFSTSKNVNVTVKVNDEYNGQSNYGVFLYAADPASVSNPTALATGNAKKGTDFTSSISVPAAAEYVYVRVLTPANLYQARAFAIKSDNTVDADFTASATTNAAKMTRGRLKVVSNPAFNTSVFPSTIPDGTVEWANSGDGTFKITKSGSYSNLKGTYYISAPNQTVTLTSMNNQNMKLYVMKNTHVVLSSYFSLSSSVITIDEGATLTYNNGMQLESSSNLYNRGTFEGTAGSFIYNLSTVYNNGVFSVPTLQSSGNGDGYGFFNYKTLNVSGSYTFGGGGTFINESGATATITGATNHQGTNEYFLNEGTYITGSMGITASSVDNYNDCKLIVNGTLSIGAIHTLTMMAGSYLECSSLSMSQNGTIKMYENSFFNVKNITSFTNLRNSGNGFYGVGSGYAVAELGSTSSSNCGDNSLYNGKLYIHVSNKQSLTEKQNDNLYTYDKTNVTLTVGESEHPSIVIPASTCNPGYNYTSTPPVVSFTKTYEAVYAMEDNYPNYGDYDLNDVVVYLKIVGSGSDQSTKKIQSATIDSKILANGIEYINGFGVQFLGAQFSGDGAETESTGDVMMLCNNVAGKTGAKYYRVKSNKPSSLSDAITTGVPLDTKKITFSTDVNDDYFADANINFFSTVNKGNGVAEIHLKGYKHTGSDDRKYVTRTGSDSRKDPLSIDCFETSTGWMWGMRLSPSSNWIWPNEYQIITNAYPNFQNWVNSGGLSNYDWYSTSN